MIRKRNRVIIQIDDIGTRGIKGNLFFGLPGKYQRVRRACSNCPDIQRRRRGSIVNRIGKLDGILILHNNVVLALIGEYINILSFRVGEVSHPLTGNQSVVGKCDCVLVNLNHVVIRAFKPHCVLQTQAVLSTAVDAPVVKINGSSMG